jgi:hypothetical protein
VSISLSRYRILIASGRQASALLALTAVTCDASPLFDDDTVINVDLVGPLSTLIESKSRSEESGFVISGDGFAIPVQLRARGNSRLVVCSFPPLRMNFRSEENTDTVFAAQDRLKLVTHCNDKGRDANNVYEEFLAYRIMNLVSDRSYRVRLLRIRYLDTEANNTPKLLEQNGFLIESDSELAQRLDGSVVRTEGVLYSKLDDRQATLVYIYQYLIGNTDWSLVKADSAMYCCHNGDLFDVDDKLVYVPYDFDLAGLVNASYAKPNASLRIQSVRSRVYRGYCTSPDTIKNSLRTIVSLKSEILAIAASVPTVTTKEAAARQSFLEQFFDKAQDEDRLLKTFAKQCI